MKKLDQLLQKADLFEKLATYGDRRSFLKSLAQNVLSNDIKERLNSLVQDLSAIKPTSSQALQNTLMDFLSGTKTDLNELQKAVLQASGAISPTTNPTQYERALQLSDLINNQMSGSNLPSQTTQEITIAPETVYAPIPKDIQTMLSRINTSEGWGLPLTISGKIDSDTRKALSKFKEKNSLTHASNPEVFQAIKTMSSKPEIEYA